MPFFLCHRKTVGTKVHALNIILQYFENQRLKIENGQIVVLTFCFQFPLTKIKAIKNSNLNKNGVTAR